MSLLPRYIGALEAREARAQAIQTRDLDRRRRGRKGSGDSHFLVGGSRNN